MEQTRQRIAKAIAAAGVCSRRDAERLIEDGKVSVNGELLTTPAFTVIDSDLIEINGKLITRGAAQAAPRVFLFYKPAGVICTASDPEGRTTIFDILPSHLPRLITVGRLDLNSEGLILLTNNGELAQQLMLPATGLKRTYKVRTFGTPNDHHMEQLRKGLTIDGIRYRPMRINYDRNQNEGRNRWIEVTLTEGKNREIRRVFDYLELPVNRLIRTSYGSADLGDLQPKQIFELKGEYLERMLKLAKYEQK